MQVPPNKTPAGSELEAMIAERVEKIRASPSGKGEEPIPVDLVTCSGSGLDPEISPAAAGYQAERIARERNMAVEGCGDRHQQVYHGQVPGNVRRAQGECAESESGSGWIDFKHDLLMVYRVAAHCGSPTACFRERSNRKGEMAYGRAAG